MEDATPPAYPAYHVPAYRAASEKEKKYSSAKLGMMVGLLFGELSYIVDKELEDIDKSSSFMLLTAMLSIPLLYLAEPIYNRSNCKILSGDNAHEVFVAGITTSIIVSLLAKKIIKN